MDPVFFVSEELRHDLLEYLRKQPWQDVNNLVVPLMRAESGTVPQPEPSTPAPLASQPKASPRKRRGKKATG